MGIFTTIGNIVDNTITNVADLSRGVANNLTDNKATGFIKDMKDQGTQARKLSKIEKARKKLAELEEMEKLAREQNPFED